MSQSQMSIGGSQQNTFYGNIGTSSKTNQRQQNSAHLGSRGGTLTSQQQAQQQSLASKNEIIAKYMNSLNTNKQIPTTN